MTTARFELAGVQHRLMEFQSAKVSINDELVLKPEPDNQFDPHAIAVYKDTLKVGYVPRKDNKDIYAYVMAGQVKCVVEAAWPHGCTVRVEMP
jgi:hypothetical protein